MADDWKVNTGKGEYPGSLDQFRQWAKQGRIRPEHNVFHPLQAKWIYARDVAELQPFLALAPPPVAAPGAPTKPQSMAQGSCGLAFACFFFSIAAGMFGFPQVFGILLGAAAFVFACVAVVLYLAKK